MTDERLIFVLEAYCFFNGGLLFLLLWRRFDYRYTMARYRPDAVFAGSLHTLRRILPSFVLEEFLLLAWTLVSLALCVWIG